LAARLNLEGIGDVVATVQEGKESAEMEIDTAMFVGFSCRTANSGKTTWCDWEE
jgi:hypothetical protein